MATEQKDGLPSSKQADELADHRDMVDLFLGQWRSQRPDLDARPMGVIGRISRSALLLDRRIARTLNEHDLTPGEFDILATLLRAGAPHQLSVSRLLAYSMVTSGAVANRLNQLEKARLVTRSIDPNDRRGVLVALTEYGRELVSQAVVSHLDNEESLLSALSAHERMELTRLLRRLLIALGDIAPDPPASEDARHREEPTQIKP